MRGALSGVTTLIPAVEVRGTLSGVTILVIPAVEVRGALSGVEMPSAHPGVEMPSAHPGVEVPYAMLEVENLPVVPYAIAAQDLPPPFHGDYAAGDSPWPGVPHPGCSFDAPVFNAGSGSPPGKRYDYTVCVCM